MNKIFVIAGTTTASLAVGVALLLFSPPSCACLDPVQELVMVADLDYSTPYGYSAREIEDGLNSALAGKRVVAGSPHVLFSDCVSAGDTLVKCKVLTNGSVIAGRVFDIRLIVQPDGSFVRAHVKRSWVWL